MELDSRLDAQNAFNRRVKLAFALFIAICAFFSGGDSHARQADKRPVDGACEWSNPGSQKYMLPLDQAVDRLTTIPVDVRSKLKARLADPKKHLSADDHVLIGNQSIDGQKGQWTMWDMNGGMGQICWGEVTRKSWKQERTERAMVFCESGYCLAYYSVCRNVSRAILVNPAKPLEPFKPVTKESLHTIVVDPGTIDSNLSFDFPPVSLRMRTLESSSSTEEEGDGGSGSGGSDGAWPWDSLRSLVIFPSGMAVDQGGSVPPITIDDGRKFIFPSVGDGTGSVVTPIPEPSTWLLMGLGLLFLLAMRHAKSIAMAVFTIALLISAQARAEFYTGNQLYERMQHGTPLSEGIAIGYVMGVFDRGHSVEHCAPETVTAGQVFDLVKSVMQQLPSIRNNSADTIVMSVIKSQWPCASKSSSNRSL